MKSTVFAVVAALSASRVAGHAIFQDLWINGVDQGETCVRMPTSNNPLTDVTNDNIRCNINRGAVAGRCAVKAGDTVSVEMHQQIGDRSCTLSTLQPPAIGGAHWGPVHAYLSKVSDARTADGSTPWFKIFANTWSPANNGAVSNAHQRRVNGLWLTGSGRQRLVGSQGHGELLWTWYVHARTPRHTHRAILTSLQVDVKIPTDIAPGDYLLRAEVIALHVAGGLNGAQFYPSCYQITVAGSGSAIPAGVSLPGAYKNTDPGILVDIHAKMSTYVDPGPTVYAGGVSKTPGNSKCTGQAASEGPGGKPATGVS
jgi:cellulase